MSNFLFAFASNVDNYDEQEFLKSLGEKAKNRYYKEGDSIEFVFLCEIKGQWNNNVAFDKARSISGASLFLVPSWLKLNDAVREEIELAKKQNLEIKLFSHWKEDDLKEVIDFFNGWGPDFSWNDRIFNLN